MEQVYLIAYAATTATGDWSEGAPIWFIFLMIGIGVATVLIVYFAIKYATKSNRVLKEFAAQHGYRYEKAQAGSYYQTSRNIPIPGDMNRLPGNMTWRPGNMQMYWDRYPETFGKYARFTQYPFGYGTNLKIANVVSGRYNGREFFAYTYMFYVRSGGSIAYGIVAARLDSHGSVGRIDKDIFQENDYIYKVLESSLKPENIHPALDELIAKL